jgi:hypothetical protein
MTITLNLEVIPDTFNIDRSAIISARSRRLDMDQGRLQETSGSRIKVFKEYRRKKEEELKLKIACW